jgi:hypothetical protein
LSCRLYRRQEILSLGALSASAQPTRERVSLVIQIFMQNHFESFW